MRIHPLPRPRRAHGFSLPELMIAMAIGLLILAGLSTLFVKNMRAQDEIEKANRQVENGRYAIDLLTSDLRNAGYYGEFDPTLLASPAALPALCPTTLDGLKDGLPLAVQGLDDTAAGLACIGDVRTDTDVLVVRRTRTCVAGTAGCDTAAANATGPFLQASTCDNQSELDSSAAADHFAMALLNSGLTRHQRDCTATAGSGTVAPLRRYLVHVYFIANNNVAGDGIPTLKRAELGSTGTAATYAVVPLAEGIEDMQLEYGLDLVPANRGDGVADLLNANPATANGCAAAACAVSNWRSVVGVRLSLLARSARTSTGHIDSKKYSLGLNADGSVNETPAQNDGYKRHVFQSLVTLPNPTGRRLP